MTLRKYIDVKELHLEMRASEMLTRGLQLNHREPKQTKLEGFK